MPIKKMSLLLLALVLVLTACSGENTVEEIHTHLEETVELEEDFKDQQSEITNLEVQEQEIYAQIIELGMDDFEEITSLSEEAITVIEEREEKLNLERESIMNANESFVSIESLIEDIEEDEVRQKAEEMYNVMIERYATYDELYDVYTTSIGLEKELYEMLQQEELEQEVLNEHIESINESYESILTINETFNEHTTAYNELKQEFYEAADINVTLNENTDA
jgi:hypothetical protein